MKFSSVFFVPGKIGIIQRCIFIFLALVSVSWSANYSWDTSTVSGIQAGNGTWGTNNYWTTDETTLQGWPGAGNSATFAGSNGAWTVTVNGTQSVDSLHFTSSGYSLTSGTLSFVTKPGVLVDAGMSATISAAIIGTPGLSKYGTGTLNLGGTNTYNGATTINSGTISVSTVADGGLNSNLGASAPTADKLVIRGGTLAYTGGGGSTNRLFTLGTSGGTLDASGTGALNLSSSGNMGFDGSGTRTLTLTGSNTGDNELRAVIGDNGGATTLIKSGNGKWRIWGANTYTGGTIINSGTVEIMNDNALGPGTGITTLAGGTLILEPDQVYLQSKVNVTGSVTITSAHNTGLASQVYGAGTINSYNSADLAISLRGDLTNFTGTINHSQGYLRFMENASSGSADNLTVNLSETGILTNRSTLSMDLGALSGSSGTFLQANSADNGGTATFNIGYLNTNTTFAGTIKDDNTRLTAINKVGTGTLTISGNNTYTGLTTISAGALRATHASALGGTANGVIVATGARLELAGGITVSNKLATISGNGGNNYGPLQSQSGSNTWTGPVVLGATGSRVGADAWSYIDDQRSYRRWCKHL